MLHCNIHSHLGSPSSSNPHEGRLGRQPTSGPNDSETQSSRWSNLVRTLPHRVKKPATPHLLVRTEEASWMRGEVSSKKLKHVQLPTTQHSELTWPGWLRTFIGITLCISCFRLRPWTIQHARCLPGFLELLSNCSGHLIFSAADKQLALFVANEVRWAGAASGK